MSAEAQPSTTPQPAPSPAVLAGYFKFEERGTNIATEARAGLTTFFVMVYIIFVNAAILGAGFKLDPAGIAAVSAGTALIAGIMTIAMGVVGNYPLAIAAGLGINGIVAFSLTARGLTPQGAMGVIVLEGLVVTLLVVVGFREAVMNAVPLALKRAIGAGIGLFILFIGFVNGGFIATPAGGVPVVGPVFPTTTAQFLFLAGLLFTMVLWVLKVRGRPDHLDLRHHDRRADPRRCVGPDRVLGDAELRDARPVRRHQRVDGARAGRRGADDLRHHADRLLRHDGDRDRRRLGGRTGQRGRFRAGRRARAVRRQHRGDRRRGRRRQLEHHVHRERGRCRRGRPDRVRLDRDRRPLPAGHLPVAAGRASSRTRPPPRRWSSSAT